MPLPGLLSFRTLSTCITGVLAAATISGCGGGAGSSKAIPAAQTHQQPAGAKKALGKLRVDRAKARSIRSLVTRSRAHAMPLRANAGPPQPLSGDRSVLGRKRSSVSPLLGDPTYDLNFYGGPVVTSATIYNIYLNCGDGSCWGEPGGFIFGLNTSNFMHLVDQYIGSTADGRYPFGGYVFGPYDTSTTLQDEDIANVLHAVITQFGLGTDYTSIYNVFLEAGAQECSVSAGGCYGVQYCAYHGSMDFSDIGHVLYSVEPYQDIPGCQVPAYAQSSLEDSTDSTLSHEHFETITDADVALATDFAAPLAWYNPTGGEIGDLCHGTPYYAYDLFNLAYPGNVVLQQEYSNSVSGCDSGP